MIWFFFLILVISCLTCWDLRLLLLRLISYSHTSQQNAIEFIKTDIFVFVVCYYLFAFSFKLVFHIHSYFIHWQCNGIYENWFVYFCAPNGIIHQTSCSHAYQLNGVAERKYIFFLDVARAMIIHMRILTYLWSVVLCAYHLINQISSSVMW